MLPAQPVLTGSASAVAPTVAAAPSAGIGIVDEEELDISFLDDMVPQKHNGLDVPMTPPMVSSARPPSPRTFSTHRTHDDDDDDDDGDDDDDDMMMLQMMTMKQRRPKLKRRRNRGLNKSKKHILK